MKTLLTFTAILEGLTGLSLAAAPLTVVWLLTGTSLDGGAVISLARITGTALLSLSIACFLSQNNANTSGVMKAVLFYNIASTAVLLYGAIGYKLSGVGLWPATLLHAGLVVWSLVCLRRVN